MKITEMDVTTVTKGILILGYGSRKGNIEEILETQAARLRSRGRKNIYVGYFRVVHPDIKEALSQMAKDGIDEVLVLPYYIAEGRLTLEMIPKQIGLDMNPNGRVDIDGKEMSVRVSPAFGMTHVLADILCDRIAEANGSMDSGILVLGHGSRDLMDSNAEIVRMNADRLKKRGYTTVRCGFNEFSEPEIDTSITELIESGVKEIIVVPLFIARGIHLCEEMPEKMGIAPNTSSGTVTRNGRSVPLRYMRPIGDDPRLLEILDGTVSDFYGE